MSSPASHYPLESSDCQHKPTRSFSRCFPSRSPNAVSASRTYSGEFEALGRMVKRSASYPVRDWHLFASRHCGVSDHPKEKVNEMDGDSFSDGHRGRRCFPQRGIFRTSGDGTDGCSFAITARTNSVNSRFQCSPLHSSWRTNIEVIVVGETVARALAEGASILTSEGSNPRALDVAVGFVSAIGMKQLAGTVPVLYPPYRE